ncbi:hypothetical protein GCM10009530_53640 [Microbispora corallina]|uniref:Glycosyltransferase 2-like domain-containing protein n=1 Tax=Microbispora corallina TaxID=83302 RepID=A0ABQ4G4N8_9ACTN|nr:bifunctional glycosyltransferase/CDP-glycerol:glycerophosphate glycerophosphotransferase [Microbispora corallina]GIH42006.1 hypothetical protein Mco01_50060 [Microbispora corallina]
MTVSPRLSVVVPLLGDEEHIEECLSSLRDQTLQDMEVLLVGRPGADAVRDPNVTLIPPPGGSDTSAARNAGAARATGAYLAFADPAAVVPADAYRRLVEALDATGSDLACGRAARLGGRPLRTSGDVLRTRARRDPGLLDDTAAATKAFRRTFWDAHGLAFREGIEEDFPVTVPAQALSRSTDVLAEVVCLTRPHACPRPARPADRLAAMLEVAETVARHAEDLKGEYDRRLAESDALAAVLDHAPLETLAELAPRLARLDPEAVGRLPALRRLQLFLAVHGMAEELAGLREFAETRLRDHGVVRAGLTRRRLAMDYPLRHDRRLPAHLFDAERDLELRARVDDVRHADGVLRVAGHAYIAHLDSRRSRVELWLQAGNRRLPLPVRRISRPDVTADSRQSAACHDESGFATEVDAGALPAGRWALHARVRARGVVRSGRVTGGPDAGERVFRAGALQVALTRERGLVLREAAPVEASGDLGPLVTGVGWTEAGELTLTGAGGGHTDRITLERGTEAHSWPLRPHDGGWTAVIGRTADGLPLARGTWRVLAGGERVRLAEALVADPPAPHRSGVHEVSLRTDKESGLSVVVRPALAPDERGPYATRRRREAPRVRTALREAAVFDSYGGGQYSCNPRAVSEELARRDPDVERIWVTRDGQFAVPPGVRTVLYGSREHEEALHTSRYVVANRRTQPGWYGKPAGQLYVQTWHGTPLKRLARDARDMPYAQKIPEEDLAGQVATWDVLVSPNPFSTPILRRAFGYDGEVLESGYPRNDVLFRPEARERARRRLGVPEGRRAVLYAPTWRDDELDRPGLPLDAGRVAAALGGGDVLLVRAHYLMAGRTVIPAPAIDVTKFPDMAELLAAADVLVTDYSSAMFDFACTGRPMIFFTPDLERYRDEVRGFYLDVEAEAPGPLVRTPDDLVGVLAAADFCPYKERYQDFAGRYCPWDDGHASARVVARMLA